MGVTGLWTVVAPTARPTQLATLNRKRLAVDASIWIYQFLKAVRDKEGNALRNSHVVGFFRRICKLLYFGIKPVFVFDGGAPVLKRETVRRRARRREGRREDAARTAGKLLAVQVARAAEEEEKRRKEREAGGRRAAQEEEEITEGQDLVYVDELGMNETERKKGRQFKRKDQYHLPDLEGGIESMGAPNDPRIMNQAELEEYARHFHSGEDINVYDFSKIDFEGPFFLSLPAGDRYNILNAARLRSRLRMGLSKEQLDGMFPDRMAFSKFQIERVKERNELTQRLMHVHGSAENFMDQGGRIAGEKGKEYVLVRNDGVEGGWALGVVSNKLGTKKEHAIDLEEEEEVEKDIEKSEEEEEFEDVAVEGLNRLPKTWKRKTKEVDYDTNYEDATAQIARKRESVYAARRAAAEKPKQAEVLRPVAADEGEGLFVRQDTNDAMDDEDDDLFEDVEIGQGNEEDDDLHRAIAMSLQPPDEDGSASGGFLLDDAKSASTSNVKHDDEDGLDLQAALAESRRSKYQAKTNVRNSSPAPSASKMKHFDGPLPFESLNLGQSLLGKKKSKQVEENLSGGFDRNMGDDEFRKDKPALPLPSWFEAAPSDKDSRRRNPFEESDDEDDNTAGRMRPQETLLRHDTKEVIDLEAEDDMEQQDIDVDEEPPDIDGFSVEEDQPSGIASQSEVPQMVQEHVENLDDEETAAKLRRSLEREERYRMAQQIAAENEIQPTMGDLADFAQADPPPQTEKPAFVPTGEPAAAMQGDTRQVDDSEIDWSESGTEDAPLSRLSPSEMPVGGLFVPAKSGHAASPHDAGGDEDEDFEDVDMHTTKLAPIGASLSPIDNIDLAVDDLDSRFLIADDEAPNTALTPTNRPPAPEEDYFSDSDEEVMRQLAIEAEEHARFASSLNNTKTQAEAIRDYESELKELRNQQKKDRRDADEVTQTMIQECQALLRLFGLPYITAPMEAEAQCAELVHLGLVDGIVTDDSDIFLFGGTRIYKNMFNAAKFVECYLAADLEKEYALDRKKLIRFAHLLGSDYTEGIPGIGPVSALEILTEFPTLEEFKVWCSKIQLGDPRDMEGQLTTPFRRKFKNTVQKKLFLPNNFPDLRVDEAYLEPEVDSDPAELQWGVPDLDKLRGFLMATIGWSQERTDEILVPVVRDMNKREAEGTQTNITRFFEGAVGLGVAGPTDAVGAPRNRTGKESGRMRNAYTRLRGEAERRKRGELTNYHDGNGVDGQGERSGVAEAEETEEATSTKPKPNPKPKTPRMKRKSVPNDAAAKENAGGLDGGDESDFDPVVKAKRGRKRQRKSTA